MAKTLLHGTTVALPEASARTGGPPPAVLLRGPSGAGKSDLALRLMQRGWRLVADDQTEVTAEAGRLIARAPAAIAGRIEVRGLGLLPAEALSRARLCLIVDLVPAAEVERLPEPGREDLLGIALPRIALAPFEASATAKLHLAATRAATDSGARAEGKGTMASKADGKAGRKAHKRPERRRVVLVTGLSGAGRSLALDILEDLGYEAVDNPPLELLETVVVDEGDRPIALGVDIRTRHFAVEPFLAQLDRLKHDKALAVSLLFLDCDEETLQRRYTETRRRHPLAQGRPLRDGIAAERRLVAPLRDRADLLVDTTTLTPPDLRRFLSEQLATTESQGMAVFVTSFSYRHGLPRTADLVFDVRFLSNPHYVEALRPCSGRDPAVAAHIEADPQYQPFFTHLTGLLDPLLPLYEREGKSYLSIAVGCTGGRHRSVMVAERLSSWLQETGYRVTLVHRDLAAEPEEA